MKIDLFRLLGWVMPGICLAGAAGALYSRQQSLSAAQVALESANKALRLASEEKTAVDLQPAARRYAAADESKMEETLFLNDIRQRAKASGVNIISWTSTSVPAIPGGGAKATPASNTSKTDAPPATAAPTDPLSDITKVVSNLALAGPYTSLRAFVGGLASSDRLFTVTNVAWSRSTKNTELSVTITRFVAPPSATPVDETKKPQTLAEKASTPNSPQTKTPELSEGKS